MKISGIGTRSNIYRVSVYAGTLSTSNLWSLGF
jgi:hypothetical protein